MEFFLFEREKYDRIYNCSLLTAEEWDRHRRPNLLLGVFGITTGIVYLFTYIPCLIVMLKRELIMHSCYKLMFYLGILDCLAILCSCVLSGIFSIMGTLACPYLTTFQYLVTAISLGIWCSECLTCVVLAFNRCVELWRHTYLLALFSHHRTYYWIGLCLFYLLVVAFYGKGLFFSSKVHAWFFDPYFGIAEIRVDRKQYANVIHTVNNIGVIVLLSVLNAALLVSLYWKTRRSQSTYLSKMQRRITIQTFLVCLINFSAAFVYAYMQFFAVPVILVVIGQIMWQFSTGLAPFVYLLLNPTIRQGVVELLQPSIIDPFNRIVSSYSSVADNERKTTETTPISRFFHGTAKYSFV